MPTDYPDGTMAILWIGDVDYTGYYTEIADKWSVNGHLMNADEFDTIVPLSEARKAVAYREALEFYADESTYKVDEFQVGEDQDTGAPIIQTITPVVYDNGRIASAALSGEGVVK